MGRKRTRDFSSPSFERLRFTRYVAAAVAAAYALWLSKAIDSQFRWTEPELTALGVATCGLAFLLFAWLTERAIAINRSRRAQREVAGLLRAYLARVASGVGEIQALTSAATVDQTVGHFMNEYGVLISMSNRLPILISRCAVVDVDTWDLEIIAEMMRHSEVTVDAINSGALDGRKIRAVADSLAFSREVTTNLVRHWLTERGFDLPPEGTIPRRSSWRATPLPRAPLRSDYSTMRHLDFTHAVLHVVKATGKLAAMSENADHGREEHRDPDGDADSLTDFPRDDVEKYAADLVICAMRLANVRPGGAFDLWSAVLRRIDSKNGSNLAAGSGLSAASPACASGKPSGVTGATREDITALLAELRALRKVRDAARKTSKLGYSLIGFEVGSLHPNDLALNQLQDALAALPEEG